ncbi:hypothetical protein FisN_30Lh098 [Fistulifera solaris]|uniref:Phytoene synthase n=1 Tax=Fistulifera solaris TaxID=1519565 RepID=A0A1Z5JIH2_FISSO|nr:hypothetical protein FisN_30Lh098 [Fistulifera solaris]|eukprot:GAX13804.1 hypothetical protein FisN_30Lh098 [Fistulifera solaris]
MMTAGRSTMFRLYSRTTTTTTRTKRHLIAFYYSTQSSRDKQPNKKDDLQHTIQMVQTYDPAGYLPGQLLPTTQMQEGYYAVRSFWVETGLRKQSSLGSIAVTSPQEYLNAWKDGITAVFDDNNQDKASSHPTLRLLHSLRPHFPSSDPFLQVLQARQYELESPQFRTLQEVKQHATRSCGNLLSLVLWTGDKTPTTHPYSHQAAQCLGQAHGLVQALRTSIPVLSNTGRLLLPQDLLQQEGVASPRYLLSALSQGDEVGTAALARVVERMAVEARHSLQKARQWQTEVREESSSAVLLPSYALETYLDRLAAKQYRLTDRSLRNVSWMEHAQCSFRMIFGYYNRTY